MRFQAYIRYAVFAVLAVAVAVLAHHYSLSTGIPFLIAGVAVPGSIRIRVPKSKNQNGYVVKTLEEVQNNPMRSFASYMDNIIGARTQIFYDAVVIASGTALTLGQKVSLFKEGVEENGKIWNTAAAFVKFKRHTNMVESGQFEYGVSVIVYAMEILFLGLGSAPTTLGTDGEIQDAADAAVQPTRYNAVNFMRALLLQTGYTFRRGADVTEENGFLIDLPSNAGLSGSMGGQTNLALIQNSLGPASARLLEYPKVLHSKENFQVDLEALGTSLAIPITTTFHFRLIAKRLRMAQSS